jgi:predicted GH43/DUF377 family glycosyl hydrolase
MLKYNLRRAYKNLMGKKTSFPGIVIHTGDKGTWDSQWLLDPCVLKLKDKYYMWYTGYDGERLRIGLAVSSNGKDWTKHPNNPLLDPGMAETWEGTHVYNPWVVAVRDNLYMWYAGAKVGGGKWQVRIGLATSSNGESWTKFSGNPVLSPEKGWESDSVFGPCVLIIGSKYYMWYAGGEIPRGVGLATSNDGQTWVKYAANPILKGVPGTWEDAGMDRPDVIKKDDMYYMYYSGIQGPYTRIGLATSTDGKIWTKSLANPVLDLDKGAWDDTYVADCWVMKMNDEYYMWYRGHDGKYSHIGLATSPEGISWRKMKS